MMTVVDLGARARQYNEPVPQDVAEALGARLMAASADIARHQAAFLDLVGEFDALDAAGWWTGIQSTAHWLSWACSIAPGTAREHVRVARALRRMPLVRQAFATGDLTYSKVRELTRVADELRHDETTRIDSHSGGPGQPESVHEADQVEPADEESGQNESEPEESGQDGSGMPDLDEAGLLEFARACTASQLARSVSGWRAAKGTSRARRARQKVSWITQDDGTIRLTAILPAEEGAAVITAIQAAADANTDPEPLPGEEQPDDQGPRDWEQNLHRTRVEGLTEICNHYLASCPDDRSGEDRTMVVVEISAEVLAAAESAGRAFPRERPERNEQPRSERSGGSGGCGGVRTTFPRERPHAARDRKFAAQSEMQDPWRPSHRDHRCPNGTLRLRASRHHHRPDGRATRSRTGATSGHQTPAARPHDP